MQAQPAAVLPDPALFVNLVQALKDCTLASVDSIITERETVVSKDEEQVRTPPSEGGWNFRKFLLTKVSGRQAVIIELVDSVLMVIFPGMLGMRIRKLWLSGGCAASVRRARRVPGDGDAGTSGVDRTSRHGGIGDRRAAPFVSRRRSVNFPTTTTTTGSSEDIEWRLVHFQSSVFSVSEAKRDAANRTDRQSDITGASDDSTWRYLHQFRRQMAQITQGKYLESQSSHAT